MAYHGTTAASSLSNPPIKLISGVGNYNYQSTGHGGGRQVWLYNSSNATSDVQAANFFTDAKYLGMRQGDIILGTVATGSSVSFYAGVISSVTTAGANLASSGGFLSSTR